MSQEPIDIARLLAGVYGHRLERPVVYTQGVSLSGRLRLYGLDPESADPVREIESVVAGYVDEPGAIFSEDDGTANFAGLLWGDELAEATGDERYARLVMDVADRFRVRGGHGLPAPLDPDFRVEDMFFSATMLGRAFGISGDEALLSIGAEFLLEAAERLQQPDGLFWHCLSSPFCWGRGNGFAALGSAELLSYMPEDFHGRDDLVAVHQRHLQALADHQDRSGMWRQVISREDTYLEHSATCMIGYSMARGLRRGWLEAELTEPVERAWSGASARIDDKGEIDGVCVGTGPLASLEEYVERPYSTGRDDRGGAMALWFAVEMARLAENPENTKSFDRGR